MEWLCAIMTQIAEEYTAHRQRNTAEGIYKQIEAGRRKGVTWDFLMN